MAISLTAVLLVVALQDRVIAESDDSSIKFVYELGTDGDGEGQFDDPTGVAVASDGSVYVVDKDNDRIQKFSVGQ